MTSDAWRRTAATVVVVAALAGIGVVDRLMARPSVDAEASARAVAVAGAGGSAVVAHSRASSSAWYCAGTAGAPAGAQASVVLTNPGRRPVTGTLDARTPGASAVEGKGFAVPAAGQLAVPMSRPGAVRVLLDGGGVGVLEALSSPLGWSTAPCASQMSTQWFFAHGSTASGYAAQLSVFNPTPADAVVDVTFVSATGGVQTPPAYQGLPVPAGQVVVESLSDHVQNDPSFATVVKALTGTVVAAETTEAGTPGNGGTWITNGTPSPVRRWGFAHNTDLTGGGNVFSVFNPSSKPATVTVSVALAQGQAAPLNLAVGASSVATLTAENQTRIPQNTEFGLTFSSSGPGIVVSRETYVAGGAAPDRGGTTGAPGGQSRWLVPPVPPPGTGPWALTVLNVAGRPVRVTLAALLPSGASAPLTGLARAPLRTDGLLVLGPTPSPPVGQVPLEVQADGPVVVELDPQPVAAPGVVVVPAWPLLAAG